MKAGRLLALLIGMTLATAAAAQAFTTASPIALISDDPQSAARLHESLKRRFTNVVIRSSLDDARGESGTDVAIVVTTSKDKSSVNAYGSSLPVCHVMMTAQVVQLPDAALQFSKSADGKAPDCAAAREVADGKLADELLRSLEEYRRHGTEREQETLWVELADSWSDADLGELRSGLLGITGIRRIDPESDGTVLKLEIYREARVLAREIDQLDSIRVTRVEGSRIHVRPRDAQGPTVASARAELEPGRLPDRQTTRGSQPAARAQAMRLPAATGRKWALVIGISSFQDASIPGLTFTAKDARAFAEVLTDPTGGGFQKDDVVLILDADATTRRLKTELDYLARMTEPEDLFVFYFSSHAVPGNYDAAGDAYLVTHDTEKSSLYATGLPMRELVDALSERIRARTVVGFLDACNTGQVVNRSGDSFAGEKAVEYEPDGSAPTLSWSREWDALSKKSLAPRAASKGTVEPEPNAKRVVLISSSDGDQVSWESEELGHGFFTYYLIEALQDSRGMRTVKSLFDFVKVEVKRAVLREKGKLQEPRMFFNHDAEFQIGAVATNQ